MDTQHATSVGVDALFSVRDKSVLITGGSRGIGLMIARGFVEGGAEVYISSRKAEACEAAATELSEVGICVSVLGWLYLVYVLAIKIFTDRAIPGWTSVTAAVLLLGGAQLVFLGILGQYVGRMYDDVKRRPLFLISEDTRK